MSKKYGVPVDVEKKLRARDKVCVYCKKPMNDPRSGGRRSSWGTIEHLNRLPSFEYPVPLAICCFSCNASRGEKRLLDWFESPYCKERNINEKTVAEPVKKYLQTPGSMA